MTYLVEGWGRPVTTRWIEELKKRKETYIKPGPSGWHCLATDDQVVKSIKKRKKIFFYSFVLLRNDKSINSNNEMEFHFRIDIIEKSIVQQS